MDLVRGWHYNRAYESALSLEAHFIYILDTYIVQILVHKHFDQVSSLLALEATEPVSELVMEVELIKIHFSTAKEISVNATIFSM